MDKLDRGQQWAFAAKKTPWVPMGKVLPADQKGLSCPCTFFQVGTPSRGKNRDVVDQIQ